MINSRTKGHVSERAVANFLKDNGWPLAITSRNYVGTDGLSQESDVIGIPGVSIEVKNRYDLNIGSALTQAAIQGGPTKMPLLIAKPYRVADVGDWWAITYVRSILPLLPREGDL